MTITLLLYNVKLSLFIFIHLWSTQLTDFSYTHTDFTVRYRDIETDSVFV